MLLWGGAPAGYVDTFCELTSLDRDALEFAVNCPTPMPPRRLAPKQAAAPRALGPEHLAPANQALETPNEKALRERVETLEAGHPGLRKSLEMVQELLEARHRGLREKGEMLEAGQRGLREEIATLRGQLEELQKELRGSRTTSSFVAVSEDHVLHDAELHGDRDHDGD